MAAYIIFMRQKTTDSLEMEKYAKIAAGALDGQPVKVLAAHTQFEIIEGPLVETVVILEFPCMAEAKAWYSGPAYQQALQHRLKGSLYQFVILVDGLNSQWSDTTHQ